MKKRYQLKLHDTSTKVVYIEESSEGGGLFSSSRPVWHLYEETYGLFSTSKRYLQKSETLEGCFDIIRFLFPGLKEIKPLA